MNVSKLKEFVHIAPKEPAFEMRVMPVEGQCSSTVSTCAPSTWPNSVMTPPLSPDNGYMSSVASSVISDPYNDGGRGQTNDKRKIASSEVTDGEILFLRRQRQMIKNRDSALRSRMRKKERVDQLEQQIASLEAEVSRLRAENEQLRNQLEIWRPRNSAVPPPEVESLPDGHASQSHTDPPTLANNCELETKSANTTTLTPSASKINRRGPIVVRKSAISVSIPSGRRLVRIDKRLIPFLTTCVIMSISQSLDQTGISNVTDVAKANDGPMDVHRHRVKRSVTDEDESLVDNPAYNSSSYLHMSAFRNCSHDTNYMEQSSNNTNILTNLTSSVFNFNTSTALTDKLHDLFDVSISDQIAYKIQQSKQPPLEWLDTNSDYTETAISPRMMSRVHEAGQEAFDGKLIRFLDAINYDNSSFYVISLDSHESWLDRGQKDSLLLLKGTTHMDHSQQHVSTRAPHKLSLLLPKNGSSDKTGSKDSLSMVQIDCVVTDAQWHTIQANIMPIRQDRHRPSAVVGI